MASRKEYEMLFQLNAQLGGSYNSTFSSAQKSIIAMQKEIEALSKTQSDVSAFQKQQTAIEASRKKLEVLQQQYDNIQKEMNETGEYSSALENKLLAKQQQIDKTSASIDAQNAKLTQMGAALRAAGVNTDDLAKESTKLGGQLDELKAKQQEAADKANNFGTAASQAFGAVHQAILAAGVAKALQEIYEYFMSCADASMDFETAMTGVAKTTELSNLEFAAMSESVKEMATDIPATTTELAAIAETAGQLGIEKQSLLDFTEIMAMLGTATNMTSDEAATMLAQFASITGMDPSFYLNLGSTIVGLGNNYATTERNIADMSQTIAAAGSIAGMSEADILGVSAAVTSLGITAQNGGTQMTKLISDINSSVSSGEGLEKWAKAAGMEADAFADAWGNNAAGALDTFIRGLNSAYESGEDVYGILADLGITETRMVTMITSLAKSGDRLTSTLDTANQAWSENTALTSEAEKRYATTQSQLTLMQNAYNNLKIAVGDNYTPALQKLYEVGANVLNGMAEFAQQHPGLVKAVTVFVGILGTVVAALAAYAVAAKVAAAVSALLTAAIPGVNIVMGVALAVAALTAGIVALVETSKAQVDESWELTAVSRAQYNELEQLNEEYDRAVEVYGDTSYEAQRLQWQIEDLNAEYENGKQTLEEYKAAHEELMGNYEEMTSSHEESYEEIEKEQRSVLALIGKLEELTSTTDGAAKNQQAILAIIDALNESVPDLALSYDDVVNSSGGFIDSLESIAKARAAQLLMEEKWNEYVDRVGQKSTLEAAKEAAETNAEIAQQEYDLAYQAYMDAIDLYKYVPDQTGMAVYYGTKEEGAALDAAREQLDTYNATLSETNAAYEENAQALSELEGAFQSYQAEQDAAAASGENIREVITGITDQMTELAAKYDEAYNAALDSVQGQYSLWDEAARVVATSADTINQNLEGQITYWQEYNANLASLTDKSDDIDGLSEMIASFADGSADSVNAIAGMAKASDEDLAAMVANWQALQEEQKTVSGSLAELETDFANSMDALQKELEDTIGEMSLGEEAAQSGKDTIQGFVDGAEDMLPQVQAAYKKVADAAIAAIDAQLDIHSPSRVMEEKAAMTWAGYINQTEAMAPDVAAAMAGTAGAGVAATAEEMQIVAFAPQLMSYLSALGGNEAVSAELGSGGGYIALTIAPSYNIEGASNAAEIEAALRAQNDNLRDLVLELLEEAGVDTARRAYV